jgi:hypothetical protein
MTMEKPSYAHGANPLDIFATFDRDTLAGAVEVLVAVIDAMDGEPNDEDDDEPGQCDEDEVNTLHAYAMGGGPGCEISDMGEHDGTDEGDQAWPERHGHQPATMNAFGLEDTEDDDPDEENGDEKDGAPSEDELMTHSFGVGSGAGCPIADPDKAVDDDGCDDINDDREHDDGF